MKLRGSDRNKYRPHQGRQERLRRSRGGFSWTHAAGMTKRLLVAAMLVKK